MVALLRGTGLDAAAVEALAGGDLLARLALLEEGDALPAAQREKAVAESLARAIAETEERLGPDWEAWRWGDLHQIELRHPMDALFPPELRRSTRVGPVPRGGSAETVGNTYYRHEDFRQIVGASFRMVIDVGAWDRSVAMNNPGQSGDPRSPHYRDLLEPWARDEAFPLLYSRESVLEATRQRIVLRPAGER